MNILRYNAVKERKKHHTMRLLHTSDLHLGLSLAEHSFLPYQRKLVRWLAETIQRERCDCIVIAGDIFDTAVSSAEAIQLYNALTTALCREAGAQTILLAGNHDGADRLSACAELLRDSGLYLYGRLQFPIQPVVIDNVEIFSLPWFTANDVRPHFPEREIRNMADAMAAVLDHIRRNWTENRQHILAAHCFAAGGQTGESDTAARLSAGGAAAVPPALFDGFDYVALGHLHRPQTLRGEDGREIIRYSGSPLPYSFGEASYEKSATIYDSRQPSGQRWSFHPIKTPVRLVTLEDTYENLLEAGKSGLYQDALVSLRMTDRFGGLSTYQALREVFPYLLQYAGVTPPEEQDNPFARVTMEQVRQLSPQELAEQYCLWRTGLAMTDEQKKWLEQAAEDVLQKGGERQ